ncbi:hypothetical protein HanPSC8_Chr05g0196631 [Helianthus annuus]|nr:hypothetical protein HanPSC8_Chr05g0196631 [Helianthus annuus]
MLSSIQLSNPSTLQKKSKVTEIQNDMYEIMALDRGDELPQVMMALTRDGQLYPSLAKG